MSTSLPSSSPARGPDRPRPGFRVVIGATTWVVNGVNVFSANLARGLLAAGVPAHILLTEDNTALVQGSEALMPFPAGVPFLSLPVSPVDGWGMHWGAMVRHLEEAAPCVYIPNYDWRHSCVCPRLSDQVVVVGVVHSDDPLHYDHACRLGSAWNAVVAVSSAVAERAAQACPSVAHRIATIPNGVAIPATRPARPERERRTDTLRLVYHGALKQHQKRVLDLPGIVAAAADLGVPIQLSIAGAGPEEADLRRVAAPLVDRGLIRFLGVISPDDTAAMLETQDVYLLVSEFEGMPNALIEAMGRGCVPVVSRMTSGIPELVRDGDNGFLVPIGDASAFAERLRTLWNDPTRREQMSIRAFQTVQEGRFRVEDMVRSYQQLFEEAWNEVRTGRFVRPRGPLSPPPPAVAGVNVFPVALPHNEPGVGRFPSAEDAEDYDLQVRAISRDSGKPRAAARDRTRAALSRPLDGTRVIVATPVWTSNGVNLWFEDLIRGLRHAKLDARLLVTEETTALIRNDEPRLARPSDLPIDELRVNGPDNWGAQWGAMLRTLEAAAPCIYFPGYDIRHSCIVPALSEGVTVVGTLHDDGSFLTEHAARLGGYWNAVVATSPSIARHVRRTLPRLEDRLETIPHGLSVPAAPVEKPPTPNGAIALLILGNTGQEPAEWVEALARALASNQAAFQSFIVDPPLSLSDTLAALGAQIVHHPNRQEWLSLCDTSRFVVANGAGGDASRMMVEAMGHGCIPASAMSQPSDGGLIRDGENGVVSPPGAWESLLARIGQITANPVEHARMAARAYSTARSAGYRLDQMIDAYLDLFQRLMTEAAAAGGFRRTRGPILPEPAQLHTRFRRHTALGTFPTWSDARRFRDEAGLGRCRPFAWFWR